MDTSSTTFSSGQRRLALTHQPATSSLVATPSESTSRTIHFRNIVVSVVDHGVGYASAAKGWCKDYLVPGRFATQHENGASSCDIELGKPEVPDSPDIINYDGTVSDPEPRRPTDPKSKMTKKAKKEKQKRDYFLFKDSPPFIFWLKESWNDLLFFALSGAVALVIYTALDPLGPRYFPLTYVGQVIFPQLAYPYMKEYVPTWLSAVVSNLVPFAFIGLISIFWIGDLSHLIQIMGQSYAMSAATLFQSLLKYLIGGFRPHFLEVCDPHPGIPEGYQNIYYDTSICRGNSKHIKEAMASFPSGHATAAFAGFIFLALWINAKFKVFADYQTRYWQTLLFTCPIAIACLIAASKTIDYWHHWSDIIAGAIIGTFFAFWGYRQVYRSVFDWRYNHEPLPRHFMSPTLGMRLPRRDLTAIDFGGWRNLHSKPSPTHKELFDRATLSSSSKHAKVGSSSIPQVDGAHDIEPELSNATHTYSWPSKRSQSHPGLHLPSLGSSLHCNSVSDRESPAVFVPTNSGFEIGSYSERVTSGGFSRMLTGASGNPVPVTSTLKRVTGSEGLGREWKGKGV